MTQTQNYENNWIIICLVDKSFLHLLGLIMDGGGGGGGGVFFLGKLDYPEVNPLSIPLPHSANPADR